MNIWFNHWFSTAYHFIDMLKEKGYTIIATNERPTCVYKMNADKFYLEPVFEDKNDYLKLCLEFCEKENINVFFPKRNLDIITKNLKLFQSKNIVVICEEDYALYDLLQSKVDTMIYFYNNDIKVNLPEMTIVNNVEDFKNEYARLIKKYPKLCVKYNKDEGGQSYKLITDRLPNINRISENYGLAYSYEYIVECLSSVQYFDDLIIMPYLEGEEVSVDCLGLEDDLIAIPRYKLSNRVTRLVLEKDLIEIAKDFYKKSKLKGPFNLQFRYSNNELYLLEVNTRLSGGSWKAKYMGCEFPVLCVEKYLNKLQQLPKLDIDYIDISNIESAVVLERGNLND